MEKVKNILFMVLMGLLGVLSFVVGAIVSIYLTDYVVDFSNIDTRSCYFFAGDDNE